MLDRADGFPSFYEGLLVEVTVLWEFTDIDYFIAMHTPVTRRLDGHRQCENTDRRQTKKNVSAKANG